MTSPGDVTDNYVQLMRERGWSWDDLADEFERQAVGPPLPLDRGVVARGMARWARTQAEAGQARREAQTDPGAPEVRPDDAAPAPPPRKVVPPVKRRA